MNAMGRKWMAKELYEQCPICEAEGEIPEDKFQGGFARIPTAPGRIECPGCAGDGMIMIGVTVGQLERLRGRVDVLLAACRETLRRLAADSHAAPEMIEILRTAIARAGGHRPDPSEDPSCQP